MRTQKFHKNFSGKLGHIRAKILRTLKNLLAPTPMFLPNSIIFYITGVVKLRLASRMRFFELSEKLCISFLFILQSVEIL